MDIAQIPGLRQHLETKGHHLYRVIDANQVESWSYPVEAEGLILGYSVDQSREYLKRQVDIVESSKFDDAFIAQYGYVPPPQQMLKWPDKEKEAKAWYEWAQGTREDPEPATEIIDKEVTAQQSKEARVVKVMFKAASLEALRGAIEHNSVVLDDLLNAATSFAELSSVDINSGWPV